MQRIVEVVIGIMVIVISSGCGRQLSNSSDRSALVAANNTFALEFYRKLAEQTKEEKNLFCSPLGVSAVLTMAYAGAQGKTALEIEKTFHLEYLNDRVYPAFHDILITLTDTSDYKLYLANQVWVQSGYPLADRFVDINRRCYGSAPRLVDFGGSSNAGQIIGQWISRETHGQIKNSRFPVNDLTNLLLTSVIYFKGTWVDQFDPKKTLPDDFYPLNNEILKVPMMRQVATFNYVDWGEHKLLEMPYQGKTMSMVVILPARGTNFHDFESHLSWETIKKWLDKLEKTKKLVVRIPKFNFDDNLRVDELVKAMGVREAFSGQADFSGITGSKNDFHLRGINQKVYVKVNEEGTEAYAVTSSWSLGRGGDMAKTFIADHPFIFLIRDLRTGSILFIGRVMSPPQSI